MNRKVPNTLSYFAAIEYLNKVWCSNLNFNGLFTLDIATGKIDYIGRFAGHKDNSIGLHSIVKLYEDKLIFFPHYSYSIDTYDFAGNFCSCEINSWKIAKKVSTFTCSAGAYIWGDLCYIFPRFPGMNMIKFSPEKNEICEEVELKIANKSIVVNDTNLTLRTAQAGNNIYIPIFGTNTIIKYDLENDQEEQIVLKEINKITGGMDFDGISFWLNTDGGISRYNSSFGERIYFYPCVSKCEELITSFVFRDSKVFALPAWLGAVKIIDAKTNSILEYPLDIQEIKLQKGPVSRWRNTGNCISFKESFMINPVSINSVLIMDYHTLKIKKSLLKVPYDSIPFKKFDSVTNYEKSGEDIEDFLQFVLRT